jgi:hypothetical protein
MRPARGPSDQKRLVVLIRLLIPDQPSQRQLANRDLQRDSRHGSARRLTRSTQRGVRSTTSQGYQCPLRRDPRSSRLKPTNWVSRRIRRRLPATSRAASRTSYSGWFDNSAFGALDCCHAPSPRSARKWRAIRCAATEGDSRSIQRQYSSTSLSGTPGQRDRVGPPPKTIKRPLVAQLLRAQSLPAQCHELTVPARSTR